MSIARCPRDSTFCSSHAFGLAWRILELRHIFLASRKKQSRADFAANYLSRASIEISSFLINDVCIDVCRFEVQMISLALSIIFTENLIKSTLAALLPKCNKDFNFANNRNECLSRNLESCPVHLPFRGAGCRQTRAEHVYKPNRKKQRPLGSRARITLSTELHLAQPL